MYTFNERRGTWMLEPVAEAAGVADVYEAIWANRFAIVRGSPINCGSCSHPPADGVTSTFTPRTGNWKRTAPDPLRTDHLSSVWTGDALLLNNGTSIQGGSIDIEPGDATAYEPVTNTWTKLPRPTAGCVDPATPLWTGQAVLTYCSRPTDAAPNSGLVFTPR